MIMVHEKLSSVILAAGEGTRLKKYTSNLPKGMLPFAGKTIIERQVALMRAAGISRIALVKGFAGEKINYQQIRYYENPDFRKSNMVVSLLCARDELAGTTIVSYADILYEMRILRGILLQEGDIVVAVDSDWQYYWNRRYGSTSVDVESLRLDVHGNILALGNGAPSEEEIDARYIGILKFSARAHLWIGDLWRKLTDRLGDDPWPITGKPLRQAAMTDLLQALIDEGHPVRAFAVKRGWLEFDTNEDYEKAVQWYQDGTLSELIELS